MTIPPQLYDEINTKLIGILESYEDQLTQYDILVMAVNLLTSYMEVLEKVTLIPRDKLFNDVIELMKSSDFKGYVPKN